MRKANPEVDEFLRKANLWQKEMGILRTIARDCQLTEDFKWKQPCYTFQGKNVVIVSEFKEYCALNFFKGALLKDSQGILIKPGENTRAGRQIRFTSAQEIDRMEFTLRAYIAEAIEVEKAGLKVEFKQSAELPIPEEFQLLLEEDPDLKNAFNQLTPGRQKAYLLYFTAGKQSKTRTARIEKYRDRILTGKGINDCICGMSRKLPYCDGSHRNSQCE